VLGVGEKFPTFSLTACITVGGKSVFRAVSDQNFSGKWKVYFFWGKDFTEHGRTELIQFARLAPEFVARNTQLISVSIESETAHAAWREADPALRDLPFLMLADTRRNLSGQLGILDEMQGTAQPAAFIVDPRDTIRFVYVADVDVAPDPGEVLRVLADLQDIAPAAPS
jgi:peroxiredoxin (alkyl hydroperoxide reductase subunit C)